MSEDYEFDDSALQEKYEQICEEFLELLRAGVKPNRQVFVEQNPDLAPNLDIQLRVLESVFRVEANKSISTQEEYEQTLLIGRNLTGEVSQKFNCPHCGHGVQLVESVHELTCEACGSSIEVNGKSSPSISRFRYPEKIGRFEIDRILGQGSFGLVFLARDPDLNRNIALKVPRQGYFFSNEEEQRFFREAQSAARLNHPNIVTVHEVSSFRKTPYIVSKFIEGVTLSDLARTKTLNFRQIAQLMVQISDAVDFAHKNGILHRDLKLSNVMIGSEVTPYVTDFGMARSDDGDITMTMEGTILGTPAYMSPEQASGHQSLIDYQSDIYSLGVMLYKLLSHELPFSGSRRMLLEKVVNDDPIRPTKFESSIPRDLETITLKAMSREKARRYKTAEHLKKDLQRWLEGRPILARPVGFLERTYRWTRRNNAWATSIALAIAMMLFSILFFWWTARNERGLKLEAKAYATKAEEKRVESEQRLFQNYMQNGQTALKNNLIIRSLYWHSKALALKDTAEMRLRCGLLLDQAPKLTGIYPVNASFSAVRYSPDGRKIAIGTRNGTVFVYDTETNELLAKIANESVINYRLRFLDGGKLLAFRSSPNSVKIWNVEIDSVQDEIFTRSRIVGFHTIASGKQLVVAENNEKIHFWDVANKKITREKTFDGIRIKKFFFATDNRLFIETGEQKSINTVLRLYDLENDKEIAATNFINQVQVDLSSSQSVYLTGDLRQNQIKVWRLSDGKQVGKTIESPDRLTDYRFCKEKDLVMAVVDSRVLRKWDIKTATRKDPEILFNESINEFALNKSRELICVRGTSGQTVTYNVSQGMEVGSRIDQLSNTRFIAFHPTQDQVTVENEDQVVRTWDLSATQPEHIRLDHQKAVRDGVFIPDSELCVTACMDGNAYIWKTATGEKIFTLAHDAAIYEVAVSEDGKFIATASDDKTARLWSKSGTELQKLIHDDSVVSLAFSKNGEKILCGCKNGSVYCWSSKPDNKEAAKPLYRIKHGDSAAYVSASSGDNKLFTTWGNDGKLKVWDLSNGKGLGSILQSGRAIRDSVFPNEKDNIIVADDSQLSLLQVKTSDLISQVTLPSATFNLSKIVFDQKENLLAYSYGVVTRYSIDSQSLSKKASYSHPALIQTVSGCYIKSDGLIVGCGGVSESDRNSGKNGAIAIWSGNGSTVMAPPFRHDKFVRRVRYDARSRLLLSSDSGGVSKLFKLKSYEGDIALLKNATRFFYSDSETDQPNENDGGDSTKSSLKLVEEFKNFQETNPDFFSVDAQERENWKKDLSSSGEN